MLSKLKTKTLVSEIFVPKIIEIC